MKSKITTMKKIICGAAIGAACFSMTGCIQTSGEKATETGSVEKIQEKIGKTAEAVAYKQIKDDKKTSSKLPLSKVKKTIKLYIEKNTYTSNSKKIIYTIKNTTGKTQQVRLAPKLERKTKDGYENVPCITGFCGMADPLGKELEGSILLEWYPNLNSGTYRLSFEAEKKIKKGIKQIRISDTFTYKE